MSSAGVSCRGPVTNWVNSKIFGAPSVIPHGLLFGLIVVLVGAAISLEALEILTGIVSALVVYALKETSRRQGCANEPVKPVRNCQATFSGSTSTSGGASPMQVVEAKTQPSSADGLPRCDLEQTQHSDPARAELNTMRAESELASWKLKVESEEAELAFIHTRIVELENDLAQEGATETQIDAVLMDITEAKLRAEEVEAELAQSTTKVSEWESEVAQVLSMQKRSEEVAQTSFEEISTDLMQANFPWTEEEMQNAWPDELCESLDVFCADARNTPINEWDNDKGLQ